MMDIFWGAVIGITGLLIGWFAGIFIAADLINKTDGELENGEFICEKCGKHFDNRGYEH